MCDFTRRRNRKAMSATMIGAPRNSAAVNCQPSSIAIKMPSSATRLVLAISNAIAAVKLAPLRKIERARATAAYEHEDDAAPSPHAIARVLGESLGSKRVILRFETRACTTPESAN